MDSIKYYSINFINNAVMSLKLRMKTINVYRSSFNLVKKFIRKSKYITVPSSA